MLSYKCPIIVKQVAGCLSRSYCCYGELLCHKIDSNMFINDWAVFWYHEFGVNRYRMVIMTNQNLCLGKCWKLFGATLNPNRMINYTDSAPSKNNNRFAHKGQMNEWGLHSMLKSIWWNCSTMLYYSKNPESTYDWAAFRFWAVFVQHELMSWRSYDRGERRSSDSK